MSMLPKSLHFFIDQLSGTRGSATQFHAIRKLFLLWLPIGPCAYFVDAPFGRFTVKSLFNVDGRISWFLMEVGSPITFIAALLGPLLDDRPTSWNIWKGADLSKIESLTTPTKILAACYVFHYINRSTISCLRMPTARAQAHLLIPLISFIFNICNGYLMGAWLGGRTSPLTSQSGAVPQAAVHSTLFWVGLGLWATGFAGNILHDEILYSLRRPRKDGKPRPRYSIPYGWLYSFPFGGISFPSYFCEWVEWFGFAVAACSHSPAPPSPQTALPGVSAEVARVIGHTFALPAVLPESLRTLSTYGSPPFLFVAVLVFTMMPRAIKGHRWYKEKFGKEFPKQRKIVIPGLL